MSLLKIILMCLLYCYALGLSAQNDSIEPIRLTCRVVDEKTKKPVEFAFVTIMSGSYRKTKYTNINGLCYFDSLPTGIYTLSARFTGYNKSTITDIKLTKSKTFYIALNDNMHVTPCLYFSLVLVNKTEPTHDQFNSRQIMRMPY